MWKTAGPNAVANSPSSTPRLGKTKLRAASSLVQPRPIGTDMVWLAGHAGLVFYIGALVGRLDDHPRAPREAAGTARLTRTLTRTCTLTRTRIRTPEPQSEHQP